MQFGNMQRLQQQQQQHKLHTQGTEFVEHNERRHLLRFCPGGGVLPSWGAIVRDIVFEATMELLTSNGSCTETAGDHWGKLSRLSGTCWTTMPNPPPGLSERMQRFPDNPSELSENKDDSSEEDVGVPNWDFGQIVEHRQMHSVPPGGGRAHENHTTSTTLFLHNGSRKEVGMLNRWTGP